MKQSFFFSNEAWLLALPAVVLGGWILWLFSHRLVEKRLRLFFSERFANEASLSIDRGIKLRRFLLILGVLALLGLALARPLSGPKTQTAQRHGFDFIVALDVSKSMQTEDVTPNRLGLAKKELGDFLQRESGDRIGLVLFAGDAFVQAPLTFDYDALGFVLDQSGARSISLGGTDVAKAIERAQAMLENAPATSRTLVIISDGEDLKADAVAAAHKAHQSDHLTIFTVGVGTLAGGKVPDLDYSQLPPDRQKHYVQDEYGLPAFSRMDERTMRAIADAGGGRYYELKPGESTFQQWHDQNALTLAKRDQKLDVSDYVEWFQLPLFGAILLLFAEPLLRPPARKSKLAGPGVGVVQPETLSQTFVPEYLKKASAPALAKITPLIFLLLAVPMALRGGLAQDADQLLTQGKKDEAVDLLRKASEANSGDLGLYYDYGLTLYRAGYFQEASDVFQTIESTSPDKEMQTRAMMQMGNAQYRTGEEQLRKLAPVHAAMAMERALGYYESIDTTEPSRASHTNRAAAEAALKSILLNLGRQRVTAADALTQKNSLGVAEQSLRDAMQAFERVQELEPKNEEAKNGEEEARQKLVDNLTQQAQKKAQEADAMEQSAQPPPPAIPTAPPLPATVQNPPSVPSPTPPTGLTAVPPTVPNEPAHAAAPGPSPATAAIPPPTPALTMGLATGTASPFLLKPQIERTLANPQKAVIAARKQAVADYDQALEHDPDNKAIQAARQEQLNKISDLLTANAEKTATPILATPTPAAKELNTLEQSSKTLAEALADNAANQRAQDLAQAVSKKLEEAYTHEGQTALTAAEMPSQKSKQSAGQPQQKVNLINQAATDFQKALDQNAKSEPAKAGLAEAQAKMPALYAALGQDDVAQGKAATGGTPPGAKSGASQEGMQRAVGFLEKATQDYDQAVALAPENAGYKADLAETQQLLSAYRDDLDQQMQNHGPQPGQDADTQADATTGADTSQNQKGGPGQALSMTELRGGHAAPVTNDKFWDKKIRDW